jgi:hypothetical protein
MRLFHLVHDTVSSGRRMSLVEVNGNRNLARLIAQSAVQVCAALCFPVLCCRMLCCAPLCWALGGLRANLGWYNLGGLQPVGICI